MCLRAGANGSSAIHRGCAIVTGQTSSIPSSLSLPSLSLSLARSLSGHLSVSLSLSLSLMGVAVGAQAAYQGVLSGITQDWVLTQVLVLKK